MSKFRRIFTFALAMMISLGVVTDAARAQERDPNYWSGNDILFYDPTYQAACVGGSLSGSSTKEKIWNFLLANELSPEQAAGLMGNMQKESNFIPIRYQGDSEFDPLAEGGHKGWGLVQWDSGRRIAIVKAIQKDKPHLAKYVDFKYNGIPEPNAEFPAKDFDEMLLFQLDYMLQESMEVRPVTADWFPGSSDDEWERMKEQPTLRDATLFWERNFEVSGDYPNMSKLQLRIDEAQKVFDEFKDTTAATGTGTAGCAVSTELQALTMEYAWPEYISPRTEAKRALTPTDKYRDAVNKVKSTQYFGGCIDGYCGIDCGGFVTRLIIDSNFDPEYNHGGVRGDGAGPTGVQEEWLQENWDGDILGKAGSFDVAELRPGDVAMVTGSRNHTFLYVGEIEGFGSDESTPGVASASIGDLWRAPMAGSESLTDSDFTWYRRK